MQYLDTRGAVDCRFFLLGTCTKGSSCPFRHDPTKITAVRNQQGLQDCIFFLQGRCTKGSLCPFKHDQAKLQMLMGGAPAAGPGFGEPAAAAAEPGPVTAVQQPITVDFGNGSPDVAAAARSAPPATKPAAASAATRPGAAAAQQQARPAAPALQKQQQPRQQQQQQRKRDQPEPGPRSQPAAAGGLPARGGIPSRLAGRLGPASATHSSDEGEQGSPKRARVSHQGDRGARQSRPRGDGALGLAMAALQGAIGGPGDSAPEPKAQVIRRTISQDEPAPGGRRGRAAMEGQSVKFVEDQVPALASPARGERRQPVPAAKPPPAPPKSAGKAATAAAAGERSKSAPAGERAKPAPAAARPQQQQQQQQTKAAAREPEGGKPEPIEFQPPKSLHELRKERQQRSSGSVDKPAQAAAAQKAVHSQPKPGRHKPIQWQTEVAAAAAAAPLAAPPAPKAPVQQAAAPAAAPAVPAAKKAPALQQQKPQAQPAAATAPASAPAPAPKAALAAKQQAQQQQQQQQQQEAKAQKEEGPLVSAPSIEQQGEEFEMEEFEDFGGEEGEELDDFEAQLRALEEQL